MCDVMEVTWWLLELMFVCEMKLVKCLQCHGALQGRVNVSVCRSVGAGVCISVWHVRPTAGVLRGSHMWHSLAGVWNRDTGLQRRGPVLDTRPNISLCRTAASVSGVEEQVTGRHQRVKVTCVWSPAHRWSTARVKMRGKHCCYSLPWLCVNNN